MCSDDGEVKAYLPAGEELTRLGLGLANLNPNPNLGPCLRAPRGALALGRGELGRGEVVGGEVGDELGEGDEAHQQEDPRWLGLGLRLRLRLRLGSDLRAPAAYELR